MCKSLYIRLGTGLNMAKKHKWHCGLCHSDCVVMKRGKGTKYIFCPTCDKQVAYYNPLPLLALGAGALKGLAGRALLTAGASYAGSKIAGFFGKDDKKEPIAPQGGINITDNLDIPNNFMREKYYIEKALREK
jgi:hypothetical protein